MSYSDTKELILLLGLAAETEQKEMGREGAIYIGQEATICGRAKATIEECLEMLIERDKTIAELQAERECFTEKYLPVVAEVMNHLFVLECEEEAQKLNALRQELILAKAGVAPSPPQGEGK